MSKLAESNYLKPAVDKVKKLVDEHKEKVEDRITKVSNDTLMFFVNIYEKVEKQVIPMFESVPGLINIPEKQDVEKLTEAVTSLQAKIEELNKKLDK